MIDDLKRLIRDVPNFPKPGIMFKDITPLLANPGGLALAVELLAGTPATAAVHLLQATRGLLDC